MRRVMLGCLLALYASFLAVVFTVTYEDQTAREPKSHFANADARPVAGGQEESEPPAAAEPPPPDNHTDAAYDPTDPPLKKLLHCSTKYDAHRTSRFFTALKAVFRMNNLPLTGREPGWNIDEGYAVPIDEGGKSYLVAVLRGWDHLIPGDDTQYLFLIDRDGKILDQLSCAVNARRTREAGAHPETFCTVVADNPESDGARLVVRFLPPKGESFAGDWYHTFVCQGVASGYSWNPNHTQAIPPAEFEEKGLCRVTIRDGKFVRLFPD